MCMDRFNHFINPTCNPCRLTFHPKTNEKKKGKLLEHRNDSKMNKMVTQRTTQMCDGTHPDATIDRHRVNTVVISTWEIPSEGNVDPWKNQFKGKIWKKPICERMHPAFWTRPWWERVDSFDQVTSMHGWFKTQEKLLCYCTSQSPFVHSYWEWKDTRTSCLWTSMFQTTRRPSELHERSCRVGWAKHRPCTLFLRMFKYIISHPQTAYSWTSNRLKYINRSWKVNAQRNS